MNDVITVLNFDLGRPKTTKIYVHIPTGLLFRVYDISCSTIFSNNEYEFEEIPGTERVEQYE